MYHQKYGRIVYLFLIFLLEHFRRFGLLSTRYKIKPQCSGFSIFFKSISNSLFTGGTFYLNLNNFHEYRVQHSLKSGGTKDHFKWVKSTWYHPLLKDLSVIIMTVHTVQWTEIQKSIKVSFLMLILYRHLISNLMG